MNHKPLKCLIGNPKGDHLCVQVVNRLYENCHDYWDGNWINSNIQIKAGGFRGNIKAALRINELESFYRQIIALNESLKGKACFTSLEQWLSIEITGDGLGHFEALCVAMDQPGTGSQLKFGLHFDQTEIPEILSAMRTIMDVFPVRGLNK